MLKGFKVKDPQCELKGFNMKGLQYSEAAERRNCSPMPDTGIVM